MARGYTHFPSCLWAGIRSVRQLFHSHLATATLLTRPVADWARLVFRQTAEYTGFLQADCCPISSIKRWLYLSMVCCSCSLKGPSVSALMHLQTWQVNMRATPSLSSNREEQTPTQTVVLKGYYMEKQRLLNEFSMLGYTLYDPLHFLNICPMQCLYEILYIKMNSQCHYMSHS